MRKEQRMRYYRFDGYLIAKMQGITMEQAQEASEGMRYEAYRECLKRCGEKRPCSTRTMKRWFAVDEYHKPGREQLLKLFFALGLSAEEAEEWLVNGALEPGFQVNDFREFFMMYGLEHHFTYEKCQEMIGTFLGQMSPDILMEQHHETGKMWEAYRQNCNMPEDQFMELALSMQKYFKGYSMTVLEYFRDLKDEILGYLRREYESLLEATLSETSYYQWKPGRIFPGRKKEEPLELDHIRHYLRACEKGKTSAPSDDVVGRIKEYIHILERSCDSNTQLLENLYPDREDIGAPEGSRMQRGEIRIMDDKYLSEILNVGLQKERELQLMLEGADNRRLQEQRKRCRLIDRHDLLPLIFEVAQRRYQADNVRKEYCREEAKNTFSLLANQILTACNMPCYEPGKYELDTILDVCFGETGMLSLYDIILEYQGWE